MTYKDVLYVITIYDEGSFSAAARKLYISQSALSQAIRKLEQELDIDLFLRNGIRSIPTKACRLFVEQGREVLRVWNQFESEMHLYARSSQSDLTVGLPALLLKNLMPWFGPKFEEAAPDTTLDILEERSNALEKLAAQEAIDLCVVRAPLQNTALASTRVMSPELLLAVPKNHPFCRKHPYKGLDQLEAVDLAELREERFSLLNHQRIEYVWKPLFQTAGFEPKIYRYSSMWSNIVDYIQSGKSIGFIDEVVVLHEPREDKLCYYRLKTGPITRDILVAYHPGKHLSDPEQLFIDILKSYPLLSGKNI